MGGLSLDTAVRRNENASHQSEGAVALRHDVTLHIAIVVLAGPDESTVALDAVSDHVIDQSVLVPQLPSFELLLVSLLIDLLEDVLEAAVVALEDRVLSAQVQRIVAVESVLEAGMGESLN